MRAFELSHVKTSVGVGVRYRGFRLEYARGSEGGRLHVGVGTGFYSGASSPFHSTARLFNSLRLDVRSFGTEASITSGRRCAPPTEAAASNDDAVITVTSIGFFCVRTYMSAADRVNQIPPFKLLALDGGGIRGVMTLEVLREIADACSRKSSTRDDTFVLGRLLRLHRRHQHRRHHRDRSSRWAGASRSILQVLRRAAARRCSTRPSLLRRFRYKFEDEQLAALLQEQFGADTTLGSDKLRTLLMLVMRNATTDSPWPVSQQPARQIQRSLARPDCNLNLPLWQLVRASTAAPTYFPPEIDPGRRLGPGSSSSTAG